MPATRMVAATAEAERAAMGRPVDGMPNPRPGPSGPTKAIAKATAGARGRSDGCRHRCRARGRQRRAPQPPHAFGAPAVVQRKMTDGCCATPIARRGACVRAAADTARHAPGAGVFGTAPQTADA